MRKSRCSQRGQRHRWLEYRSPSRVCNSVVSTVGTGGWPRDCKRDPGHRPKSGSMADWLAVRKKRADAAAGPLKRLIHAQDLLLRRRGKGRGAMAQRFSISGKGLRHWPVRTRE